MAVAFYRMESKPAVHKRKSKKHRSKAVNHIMPHCSYILRLLVSKKEDEEINVNEVYRKLYQFGKEKAQTGLRYKPYVLNAIELLQIGELITKNKYGQTEFLELTSLGQRVVSFNTRFRTLL